MQPSVYLHNAEYGVYGISDATAEDVIQASQLVDAYLNRPEGLIYKASTMKMVKTDQVISEELPVPIGRVVMLSRFPVISVVSVTYYNGYELITVPLTNGHLQDQRYYVPTLLPTKCRATFNYIAGYPDQLALPFQIRSSCAAIVKSIKANCDMSGNIKFQKAGDAELERFRDTLFDADIRHSLSPWVRMFVGV